MAGYTKGPWEPKTADEWENGFDFFAGKNGAFVFLADVGLEDARLIAAAPDLLEALEYAVSRDDGLKSHENVMQAIAKAKGETK